MDERAREEFLQRFAVPNNVLPIGKKEGDVVLGDAVLSCSDIREEKCLLGFCVLGGIFSEGIDLKNDSLIGAVIVGTGLPQVCNEREILKNYFDGAGENGFDYAYRYPGMNKVLQAAGRVIRTAADRGVIALLDDRFLESSYLCLFPKEWEKYAVCSCKNAGQKALDFWKKI